VKRMIGFVILSLLLGPVSVSGVDAASGEPQAAAATDTPLKVQIVVSRFQGEKKISSIPYTLAVVGGPKSEATRLRMGVDVPVPQTVIGEGSTAKSSYSYRSVGTSIDCSARPQTDGVYLVDLAVSDTAVFMPDRGADSASPASRVPGVPAFRTFTSNFNLLLKDGQVAQHTAATDPVSGEVLRIDVTLTVIKKRARCCVLSATCARPVCYVRVLRATCYVLATCPHLARRHFAPSTCARRT